MRKTTTILTIFIIASLFLLAGCQSKQVTEQTNTETITGNTVKGTETTQETSTASVSGVKEFKVTARQWSFSPSEIKVKQGDNVKLVIESVDVAHGFAIPDFNVNQRLEPGKTETVEFTADKKGTFSFFCSVQCGSGHGSMRGKLIVE